MRKPMNQKTGVSRLIAATGYTFAGLTAAFKSEEAFRQEVLLAVIMIPAALWLGQTLLERIVLIATVLIVMITELLNTAVEYTIDRIGQERHELSGHAKDIGSAAVFVSLMLALITWASFLWVRFVG